MGVLNKRFGIRDDHLAVVIAASWLFYLLIFPYDELIGGSMLVWLLLLTAVFALCASLLGINRKSVLSISLVISSSMFFGLLYVVLWGKSMIDLGPSVGSGWHLMLAVAKLKVHLASELFFESRTIRGIAFVYWELMPVLQLALIPCWVFAKPITASK